MTTLQRLKPHFHTDIQVFTAPIVRGVRAAARALPTFFLCYADLLGIPSGLYAAYMSALCAGGEQLPGALAGCLAALVMRFVWGLAPRWDMLITMALMLPGASVLRGKKNAALIGWTALTLTPGILASVAGTQADLLFSVASAAIGALAAPVVLRAVRIMHSGKNIAGMEERIAVGFLAACCVCGGGRMLALGVNLGVLTASLCVLLLARHLGVSAGMLGGMVGGLALSLAGLPVQVSVCLCAGGFLAGMLRPVGRRWLICAAYAAGSVLMMLVSGAGAFGAMNGVLLASAAVMLLPKVPDAWTRDLMRRFADQPQHGGDAFAADALRAWERSMDAMAAAVPVPVSEDGPHSAQWWRGRLCAACPDYGTCQTMCSEFAASRAEETWCLRGCPDEEWPAALEKLRGLGCGRLYCLRESMDRMRTEEPERCQAYRRACYQRDMLVTHLKAVAGAARQFAVLSGGGTWWDEVGAKGIRRLLDEQALPARLMYVRRIEGHACVAFQGESSVSVRRLETDLTRLAEAALSLKLETQRIDGTRLYLAEMPPMDAEWGLAERSVAEGAVNGDHAWLGRLDRGRFMAAVSDGMGQGERAGQESAGTVELLRLCMEAGYDRAETLTAVNGMMLLETAGERFSTVDLLTIDLWSGQGALDKLGAAGSWLQRGDTLVELTGDALPLGILEQVDSRTSFLRLHAGDRLLLMTDGVEDAFAEKEDLRRAVAVSLAVNTPQHAAETMLESAERACSTGRRDDMTAAVVFVTERRN